MKALAFVLDLISGAWSLIFKIAIVVVAIVVVVGFVKSCSANATLNEHSSCNQFEQADTATQDQVLQDMMAAHHDSQNDLSLTRASVSLYCGVHDENSPIDGIYSGGYVGQPSEQALRISVSLRIIGLREVGSSDQQTANFFAASVFAPFP